MNILYMSSLRALQLFIKQFGLVDKSWFYALFFLFFLFWNGVDFMLKCMEETIGSPIAASMAAIAITNQKLLKDLC